MVHDNFPWTHIVKGRPRHPANQGAVERSHGPYKKSLLAKLKEHQSDDWLYYMHIVQCEVNNRPSRSRGHISPFTMYYSKANKSQYSSILGKAYKEATTEYGLRLSKIVLDKIKKLDERRIMSCAEVSFMVKYGDTLFLEMAEEEVGMVHRDNVLSQGAIKLLTHFGYDVSEDDVKEDQDEDRSPRGGDYGKSHSMFTNVTGTKHNGY
jgi:hypothetical protein